MEISLALGGGGIKGIAHIGVLECLEKAGYKIGAIAGSSAGGLVGAMYASGYSPREIHAIVDSMNPDRMYMRQSTDRPSLLGLTGLSEAMTEVLGESHFAELKIPFACTAVDIITSQEIYLNEGRVLDSILATIAVPGVFPPRVLGNYELIDGSVLDPVPVNLARCMAPNLPVVAVVLNPPEEDFHRVPQFNIIPPVVPFPIPPPLIDGIARLRVAQAFRTFVQSIDISSRMLTELRLRLDRPEVIIRPDVHEYGLLDQVNPEDLIQSGYQAAELALPEIRKALSWSNTVMRILRAPRRLPQQKLELQKPPENPLPKSTNEPQ